MIRVSQLKLAVGHTEKDLERELLRELQIPGERLIKYEIWKKSVDARKKPILYVYTIDVQARDEEQILKKKRLKNNEPKDCD